jgi:hypothetical protein
MIAESRRLAVIHYQFRLKPCAPGIGPLQDNVRDVELDPRCGYCPAGNLMGRGLTSCVVKVNSVGNNF